MPILLDHVTKAFASGTRAAVDDVSLEIGDGELLVLVGPSGCGKSTLLRLIAGLEQPTSGRIVIDGQDVSTWSPQARNLAMVFQSYALYPHMTVAENLAFALRMRRVDRRAIATRVADVARALQIEALLQRRPAELSGGQRQRVALGRAIIREPRAFLLDEPLSNLDPRLRFDTRTELADLHRRLRATMIHVTHDQEEAMTLGDRIAVMRNGRVEQVAEPLDVYRRPANVFVAGFIGWPAMNLVDGAVGVDAGRVTLGGFGVSVAIESCVELAPGAPVLVGIRPRDIAVVDRGDADVVARVDLVEPLGDEFVVRARPAGADELRLTVVVSADRTITVDDRVGLRFRRDRLHVFDAGDEHRLA